MSEKVRVRILVSGRVQGVFFRDSTRRKAEDLGLTGLVRNRRDGTVEIIAEGAEATVDLLIAWARIGPPHASVEDVVVSVETPGPVMTGFVVDRTV